MPDENLLKYIKEELAQSRSEETIRSLLASNGWAQKDVDDALNFIRNEEHTSSMPTPPQNPRINDSSKGKKNFNPFSARGRINRLPYFFIVLAIAVVSTVAGWMIFFFVSGLFLPMAAFLIFDLIILIVSIDFASKRFHDLNKSGWYSLALIIPVYNIYLLLELLLRCGTEGANRFGDDSLSSSESRGDFLNRLGASPAFKIILAVLLSAWYVVMGVRNYQNQQLANRQIEQNIINSFIASSTLPSATLGTPLSAATPPSSAAVLITPSPAPTKNVNFQAGIDTSSWQTESIHFAPFSICWTIKYPSTLSPIGANNGYSNNEEFVTSVPTDASTRGVTLMADFNESYSQVSGGQSFVTLSGLNGSIEANGGSWRIFVQASEGGKNFVFVLNPYTSGQTPPYDLSTAEAMARTITLSCAVPASPQ